MDERIVKFMGKHKVLTICTSKDDKPYSASCYYAFDQINQLLIFSSEQHTKHISDAMLNSNVSGTINAENKSVAKIQGIQFLGDFIPPNVKEQKHFYEVYYERFPFAKAMPAPIWAIRLSWIKMTDNTLGFGKKLEWER